MVVPVFDGKRIVAVAGVGNKSLDYDSSDERQITLLLSGMWNHIQRNRSKEALQQAHDELEKKVQERMAELAATNKTLQEDITVRKKAEEALRVSEAKANELIKYAPVGIYELDLRNQEILNVNDSMCYILGYTREELLSMSPFSLLDDESKKFHKRGGVLKSIYEAGSDFRIKINNKWQNVTHEGLIKLCEEFSAQGEQVRLIDQVPQIMAVFDESTVFFSLYDENIPIKDMSDVIIKNRRFAKFITGLFNMYWDKADTLEVLKKELNNKTTKFSGDKTNERRYKIIFRSISYNFSFLRNCIFSGFSIGHCQVY